MSTLGKMKFLLDENVTQKALKLISELGFQVSSVQKEKLMGIKNGELSLILKSKDWIIITHDKDFRSHCVKYKLKVILIEIHPATEKFVLPVLLKFINEFQDNLSENFIISLKINNYTLTNY